MNRHQRASKTKLHSHCESCYSRHCRKKVDISVSCVLAQCGLHCGAIYHLCKEEEHMRLCPNVRVPCLNVESGCPLTMPRTCQAAHLRDCPASVVCCSMEWNRWPAEDAYAYPNTELRRNLLKDNRCRAECLDLAISLRDQDHLFHSLKMKKLFPELTQRREEDLECERKEEEMMRRKKEEKRRAALEKELAEREARRAKWAEAERIRAVERAAAEARAAEARAAEARAAAAAAAQDGESEEERELTQEEREALARGQGLSAEDLQKYSNWERMFNMEMGGCREAGQMAGPKIGQSEAKDQGKGLGVLDEEPCTSSSSSTTEGGSKGFVWCGDVEPMKIITLRTFKAPMSFHARKPRVRNPWATRANVGLDTSDLGVPLKNIPLWDEVQASLLCCLEKEQRGHLIAEASSGDTLFSDQGSQTYGFQSAPFRHNMALADLTECKPLELHLQLQVESVTSVHNKATSAFTFLCGHTFQRREYGQHFRNVHSDIQMSVNGWFEQRCPLSYLGCTYTQRRFQPFTQKANVNYIQELSSYSLCPVLPALLEEGSGYPRSSTEAPSTRSKRAGRAGGGGGTGQDSLTDLPYEVLCHMASFLDSLSLSQLALVSHLMRDVCSSLLQDRGMVTLHWERKTYSHGGAKWRVRHKVWQFSTLFSPVDRWGFQDVPSMSEHLKVCPYYERECRTERVLLPRIKQDKHINAQCKAPSLTGQFQKDKLIM